jgi:tetratricopeptide (TPR) repeat protein
MSMQAKRFWPPIKHKLLYANLIAYGVMIVLLLVFYQELIWAQKTLRSYASLGTFEPSADNLLLQEATKSLKEGGGVEHSQHLLEQALQIEPYSRARLLLGICYLRQGNDEKMLACYEQYRLIEPSFLGVYIPMIDILKKKQDYAAINNLLAEGVSYFHRRIELYQPHLDPNVPKQFNAKALVIYNKAKENLETLQKIQQSFLQNKSSTLSR